MRRVFPWIFVVLAASLPARAEQPDSPMTLGPAPTKEQVEKARLAEMASLIATGDAEKRAGRWPQAANAYARALRLGDNPLVGGRLGVLLVRLGNHVLGADYLLDAIDRADSAPSWERIEFLKAYDVAKSQVCRVSVEVSEAHAQILLDGTVKQEDGVSAFTMFIEPGDHEFRARMKGFDDAVVNFSAKKATSIRVSLALVPKTPTLPELPALSVTPALPVHVYPPLLPSSNIATDPNYSTKEDPFYEAPKPPKQPEKRWPRFAVHGGIVTIFGVASWNPAVGGVVGVGLSPNEYLSLGLEGRAAWLTTGVADRSITAMTAGGLLSACGHLKWFFGCGLGHFGVLGVEFEKVSYIEKKYMSFLPGGGGRLGARIPLGRFAWIQGNVDVIGFTRGVKIAVDQTIIAEQPPVMVGVQLSGGWEW